MLRSILDADAISRQLTARGGAAMPELAIQFGPQVVAVDGSMNRDRMRQLAFPGEEPDMLKGPEVVAAAILEQLQGDAPTGGRVRID